MSYCSTSLFDDVLARISQDNPLEDEQDNDDRDDIKIDAVGGLHTQTFHTQYSTWETFRKAPTIPRKNDKMSRLLSTSAVMPSL